MSSHSRHSHSGFHYFLTVFAFFNTLRGFAMFLAALASTGATMLLAPVFVTQPQALKALLRVRHPQCLCWSCAVLCREMVVHKKPYSHPSWLFPRRAFAHHENPPRGPAAKLWVCRPWLELFKAGVDRATQSRGSSPCLWQCVGSRWPFRSFPTQGMMVEVVLPHHCTIPGLTEASPTTEQRLPNLPLCGCQENPQTLEV